MTFDENNQLWKDSGLSFDHWDIQSKAKLLDENGEEIVNPGKTFTFVMPKEGVTIEAMPKDATIEDDGPNVLSLVLPLWVPQCWAIRPILWALNLQAS